MNIKNGLLLSIIILNSSFVLGMEQQKKKIKLDLDLLTLNDNKQESSQFVYFADLPDDIKREVLQFVLGINSKDFTFESLELKTPRQIQNILNKITSLMFVSKEFKALIYNVYLNKIDKVELKTIIAQKAKELGIILNSQIRGIELKEIKKLINKGANIEVQDSWGYTPLINACLHKSYYIVKLLIESKANLNAQCKYGRTCLEICLSDVQGDELNNIVELLIKNGVNVNLKNNDGDAALYFASAKPKHEGIVRLLIEAKADLNSKNNNGYTALMKAAQCRCEGAVRLLINAGSDLDIKDRYGDTALVIAKSVMDFEFIKKCVEIVRLLEEAQKNKNNNSRPLILSLSKDKSEEK